MKCDKLVDVGRRQFLRGGVIASAGAAAAVVMGPGAAEAKAAPTGLALVTYPSNKLGNLSALKVNEPMDIAYPDDSSPGILLKLGTKVDGGAGPDGDVVAFSVLVLILYLNGEAVTRLYRSPALLWLLGPVLLFWFYRLWKLSAQGKIPGDPIPFVFTDAVSYAVALMSGALLAVADRVKWEGCNSHSSG